MKIWLKFCWVLAEKFDLNLVKLWLTLSKFWHRWGEHLVSFGLKSGWLGFRCPVKQAVTPPSALTPPCRWLSASDPGPNPGVRARIGGREPAGAGELLGRLEIRQTPAGKRTQPPAEQRRLAVNKSHGAEPENRERFSGFRRVPTLFWRPGRRVWLIRECKSGSPLSLYSPLWGCALKCEAPSFTSSHWRSDYRCQKIKTFKQEAWINK